MAVRLSPFGRIALAAGSAAVALSNPSRADLVALFGDLTSTPTLHLLTTRISASQEGKQMLETLSPPRFPSHGSESLIAMRDLAPGTLGREYARFMDVRGFEPESRDEVRFVENDRHRWLLQRYRDVHDVWHVLTGMPTTVLGELAQKWFEASQTGLPVAVMSALVGPLRLSSGNRQVLRRDLIPWAVSCGTNAEDLLAIRYEDYLEDDVEQLRKRWRIWCPDVKLKGRR